jgi:hypothetical protein
VQSAAVPLALKGRQSELSAPAHILRSCSSVQYSDRMQRPLHPYSGGRKCKRKRRLCIRLTK